MPELGGSDAGGAGWNNTAASLVTDLKTRIFAERESEDFLVKKTRKKVVCR